MRARRLGFDLDDPLAPHWLAAAWTSFGRAGAASADLEWSATRGKSSPRLRQALRRISRDPKAVSWLEQMSARTSEAGSEASPGLWLGGEAGPAVRFDARGRVIGMGEDPLRASDALAPGQVQAVVRSVAMWAGRFELRWLMVELALASRRAGATDPRGLERALEVHFPELAGKVRVHVRPGLHAAAELGVSRLELCASFAGAPGAERMQTSLRDLLASPRWSEQLDAVGEDFAPAHALDRAQLLVDRTSLGGLGPLGRMRVWYDAQAVQAARAFTWARHCELEEAPS